MKKIILLSFLYFSISACLTPEKIMLEPKADQNYVLSDTLNEISGMINAPGGFYGLNDSGGEAAIYKVDLQNPGEIAQYIKVNNATNIDWEALTANDSLLFIGDFGNNVGNREDLKIYYFPSASIPTGNGEVDAAHISFFYPEQKNIVAQPYQHDYDAEALFYDEGKLHLFTKEWLSNRTRHFTLDLVEGKQPAWLSESLEIPFMVTDAAVKIIGNKKIVVWVGYTRDREVYLMWNKVAKNSDKYFKNKPTIVKLGKAEDLGQVESVTIQSAHEICIGAEDYTYEGKHVPQHIRCYKIK